MLEMWIPELIGKMHLYKIKKKELADALGCSTTWVSAVLNGHRAPKNGEKTFTDALEHLIQEREE